MNLIEGHENEVHCMVDIETLSTRYNAVVLSIGAILFEPFQEQVIHDDFYVALDIQEQIDNGRAVDGNTIMWWMQQDDGVRKALTETKTKFVGPAIKDFIDYLRSHKVTHLWGNGAGFDNVILRSLFDALNVEFPIRYSGDLDMRTLQWLLKGQKETVEGLTAHNARDDAIWQALMAKKWIGDFQNDIQKKSDPREVTAAASLKIAAGAKVSTAHQTEASDDAMVRGRGTDSDTPTG